MNFIRKKFVSSYLSILHLCSCRRAAALSMSRTSLLLHSLSAAAEPLGLKTTVILMKIYQHTESMHLARHWNFTEFKEKLVDQYAIFDIVIEVHPR